MILRNDRLVYYNKDFAELLNLIYSYKWYLDSSRKAEVYRNYPFINSVYHTAVMSVFSSELKDIPEIMQITIHQKFIA
jgi:hypothetical protein